MDKGNNRISIKINGQERSMEENSTEDYKQKKDSSHSNDDVLQPFIYKKEMAAAKEEEDNDEFSWVLPDEDSESSNSSNVVQIEDVRNKSKKPNPYFKSKSSLPKGKRLHGNNNSYLKTLLVSILLAVVVGLGLGTMILNFISDTESASSNPETPSTPIVATPAGEDDQGKGTETKTGSLDLAPIQAAVVQEGKYGNKDSASGLAKDMRALGIPSASVEMDGFYYVFVGIGSSKASVDELDKIFEDKAGKESFHKDIEISGGSFSNVTEQDAIYIKGSQTLFSQLLSISSNSFASSSISDDEWSKVTATFTDLEKQDTSKLSEGLQSFSSSIIEAYNQLKTYKDSKNEESLLKSQQELLNAFLNYQSWKNSLS
ncbi:SPOR domain-containing protein [Litchfieldia alkalitelluris]|uniref:SPOR domain-containing protein n=1 Tax=Litchfieldia alkalitelluris TaxID=304268 RepID=UPI0009967966|nr:SPOR domain-containing protein [Litchfieldia alkalitelluris]